MTTIAIIVTLSAAACFCAGGWLHRACTARSDYRLLLDTIVRLTDE